MRSGNFVMNEKENRKRLNKKANAFWMAEPESKSKGKVKFFWMAEPGHPHDGGVPHKEPSAGGTHKPLRKG